MNLSSHIAWGCVFYFIATNIYQYTKGNKSVTDFLHKTHEALYPPRNMSFCYCLYILKILTMHERDKERGERDYVKGNQLCFCLKRWKTITVKRIVFIKFQLIKGWKLRFISSKIWVYGCTCMKNRMIELGNITHIKNIFGKKKSHLLN